MKGARVGSARLPPSDKGFREQLSITSVSGTRFHTGGPPAHVFFASAAIPHIEKANVAVRHWHWCRGARARFFVRSTQQQVTRDREVTI